MNGKNRFFCIIFGYIIISTIFILAVGCRSTGATNSWGDASAAAGQREIIEQQRQRITELERFIEAGAEHLAEAERRLGSLEQGNSDLEDWICRVDAFIRAVIAEQRRLEDVQRADSGTDAGAR